MPIRRFDLEDKRNLDLDAASSHRRSLWMDCEYLQCCDRGKLRLAEEHFWDELIEKYLKVIILYLLFIFYSQLNLRQKNKRKLQIAYLFLEIALRFQLFYSMHFWF